LLFVDFGIDALDVGRRGGIDLDRYRIDAEPLVERPEFPPILVLGERFRLIRSDNWLAILQPDFNSVTEGGIQSRSQLCTLNSLKLTLARKLPHL
jgi:hypothetical protein